MQIKKLRDGLLGAALSLTVAILLPVATTADERTLMLYGDSLMAGLGLSAQDSFAGQLQQALGDDVTIVNASVSGDTASDGLARLDWSLAERPDAVILELGANDMLQGRSVDTMRQSLTAILQRFGDENIPVLLAGMRASPGLGTDYVNAYEAVFPELAAEFGTRFYPFFLDGVATDPSLNQADGLHPNAQGVAVIVEGILPEVEALLNR
ncbi:acyl-CoA thioesterase-1 [Devosia lucknowensis]|uniref:Acyl-CoA thioesterase-1 n=1 Tax=Devosia lucknowensis TaxID=1096929 RepID=A0A1Y6EQX5_9HYPH|nr:arylesterase [Devosia lucknowensis]SMQ65105.1 acyl-CoA thioesterase-1 [Devosia lucknowensis]